MMTTTGTPSSHNTIPRMIASMLAIEAKAPACRGFAQCLRGLTIGEGRGSLWSVQSDAKTPSADFGSGRSRRAPCCAKLFVMTDFLEEQAQTSLRPRRAQAEARSLRHVIQQTERGKT